MPSTFTTSLRLVKQATGENSETWGDIFNQQFADLVDRAVAGYQVVSMSDANRTLTAANGANDESRNMLFRFDGTLTAAREVIVPTVSKLYFVRNNTAGGFGLTVKTSSGSGIVVPPGASMALACDGTNVVSVFDNLPAATTVNGQPVGYRGIPQRSLSADYTLVLDDAGRHLYHPNTDTVARAWTIPANASVAFPIGTSITFINDLNAGVVTIQIGGTDLLIPAGGSQLGPVQPGPRSLFPAGVATAVKVAATRWIISGSGIS